MIVQWLQWHLEIGRLFDLGYWHWVIYNGAMINKRNDERNEAAVIVIEDAIKTQGRKWTVNGLIGECLLWIQSWWLPPLVHCSPR